MRKVLAALSLTAALGLGATQPSPVSASTDALDPFDVCAVLKSHFDTQGTAYRVADADARTLTGVNNTLFAVDQCLFVPRRSPNFGDLCEQAEQRIFPTPVQPWTSEPVVPRFRSDGSESPSCPPVL